MLLDLWIGLHAPGWLHFAKATLTDWLALAIPTPSPLFLQYQQSRHILI